MTTKKSFTVFAETKNITEEDNVLFIEGIANTGQEDLVGDIVTETALQQIVEQAPYRNLHYNHEDSRKDLLGRIVESELRDEGAWIRTRILDEQKDWLQSYMEQGIIFGQSISGVCTYEDGSLDNIISWELTEVSLTDTPCDPGTMGTVSISKSFDDILLSLKEKMIEEPLEDETLSEEEMITKDDVITICNDAFNERKDELLEQLREESKQEYEAIITELKERVSSLEEKLSDKEEEKEGEKPKEPEAGKEDEEKRFMEAVEKAAEEKSDAKLKAVLEGLTKNVRASYNKNEHVKDPEDVEDVESKSYTADEIARMLS
jgi:hypothetical protein